jgi:hypothetical protein
MSLQVARHFYFLYQTNFKDGVCCVRFGILMIVFLKVQLLWNAMLCHPVSSNVLRYQSTAHIFMVTVY